MQTTVTTLWGIAIISVNTVSLSSWKERALSPCAPSLPSLTSHHQPQPGCLLSRCALSKHSLLLSQMIQLVSVLRGVCLLKRLTQAATSVSVSLFRNSGSGQGRGVSGPKGDTRSSGDTEAEDRISSRISQKDMTLRMDFPHLQLPKNLCCSFGAFCDGSLFRQPWR